MELVHDHAPLVESLGLRAVEVIVRCLVLDELKDLTSSLASHASSYQFAVDVAPCQ